MSDETQKKKDFWDRLSSFSTFFSTVVIGLLGIWFTHETGWVYLGHYDAAAAAWASRYFEFDDKSPPDGLRNRTLTVTERNGAVNVRSGMPTAAGDFQEVRDVLSAKSQVTVTDVREWETSGYMWAKVSYGT